MVYVGSKARIARYFVPVIQGAIDENGLCTYVEPFVGGANVIDRIQCKRRIGFDINPYLIALLQHAKIGGELPTHMSENEYKAIRKNPSSYPMWQVGAAWFLASKGGTFGKYERTHTTKFGNSRDYYEEARRKLLYQLPNIRNVLFDCVDYGELSSRTGLTQLLTVSIKDKLPNCIYCDPPAVGATVTDRYSKNFDMDEFWDVARIWSERNLVFVSGLTAPDDFAPVWTGHSPNSLSVAQDGDKIPESLFVHQSRVDMVPPLDC